MALVSIPTTQETRFGYKCQALDLDSSLNSAAKDADANDVKERRTRSDFSFFTSELSSGYTLLLSIKENSANMCET